MAIQPTNVRYRMNPDQLDGMRDALDDLDESLRCAKRNLEKLNDLRAELRLQSANEGRD